jgi:cell division protein FtsB
MRWTRVAAGIVAAGGVVFGVFGGEYSTLDWWQLKRQVAEQEHAIARLEVEIDSLTGLAAELESDSATQERVAREHFGMIRDGELLYRVEERR